MQRIVVLGRGGAGKTTTARRLGALLSLPVVELDRHFWSRELTPLGRAEWVHRQRELCAPQRWILDGDLGTNDVLEPRLVVADTVLVLDFSFWRCAWRAARRDRERLDFWWWLLAWRRVHRPRLMREIERYAMDARLIVLRRPADVRALLSVRG